jgi:hypothetical protein
MTQVPAGTLVSFDAVEGATSYSIVVLADVPDNVPTPEPPDEGSVTGRWFRPDCYLNRRVPENPRIDEQSEAWMKVVNDATDGIFFNTNEWSTPYYVAPVGTPMRTLRVKPNTSPSEQVSIRWLDHFRATTDSDGHIVVIDEETGACTEFQGFGQQDPPYDAHSYALGNMKTGDGTPTAGRCAVLPTYSGLNRASEVRARRIEHAMRIALPCASNVARPPCIHSDGGNAAGPPGGAKYWLPTDLSSDSRLDEWQRLAALQLHEYGMVDSDSNGDNPMISGYLEATVDGCSYDLPTTSIPGWVVEQMKVLAEGQ